MNGIEIISCDESDGQLSLALCRGDLSATVKILPVGAGWSGVRIVGDGWAAFGALRLVGCLL